MIVRRDYAAPQHKGREGWVTDREAVQHKFEGPAVSKNVSFDYAKVSLEVEALRAKLAELEATVGRQQQLVIQLEGRVQAGTSELRALRTRHEEMLRCFSRESCSMCRFFSRSSRRWSTNMRRVFRSSTSEPKKPALF